MTEGGESEMIDDEPIISSESGTGTRCVKVYMCVHICGCHAIT